MVLISAERACGPVPLPEHPAMIDSARTSVILDRNLPARFGIFLGIRFVLSEASKRNSELMASQQILYRANCVGAVTPLPYLDRFCLLC